MCLLGGKKFDLFWDCCYLFFLSMGGVLCISHVIIMLGARLMRWQRVFWSYGCDRYEGALGSSHLLSGLGYMSWLRVQGALYFVIWYIWWGGMVLLAWVGDRGVKVALSNYLVA